MKENKVVLLAVLVVLVLLINSFVLFTDNNRIGSEAVIQAVSEDLNLARGEIASLELSCPESNLSCPEPVCPVLPPVQCEELDGWDTVKTQISIIANQCANIEDIESDISRIRRDVGDICDEVNADC